MQTSWIHSVVCALELAFCAPLLSLIMAPSVVVDPVPAWRVAATHGNASAHVDTATPAGVSVIVTPECTDVTDRVAAAGGCFNLTDYRFHTFQVARRRRAADRPVDGTGIVYLYRGTRHGLVVLTGTRNAALVAGKWARDGAAGAQIAYSSGMIAELTPTTSLLHHTTHLTPQSKRATALFSQQTGLVLHVHHATCSLWTRASTTACAVPDDGTSWAWCQQGATRTRARRLIGPNGGIAVDYSPSSPTHLLLHLTCDNNGADSDQTALAPHAIAGSNDLLLHTGNFEILAKNQEISVIKRYFDDIKSASRLKLDIKKSDVKFELKMPGGTKKCVNGAQCGRFQISNETSLGSILWQNVLLGTRLIAQIVRHSQQATVLCHGNKWKSFA